MGLGGVYDFAIILATSEIGLWRPTLALFVVYSRARLTIVWWDGPPLDRQLVRLLQCLCAIFTITNVVCANGFSSHGRNNLGRVQQVRPFSPHFASSLNSPASPDPLRKLPEIRSVMESFCLGTRRLEIFSRASSLRREWMTLGSIVNPPIELVRVHGIAEIQNDRRARFGRVPVRDVQGEQSYLRLRRSMDSAPGRPQE